MHSNTVWPNKSVLWNRLNFVKEVSLIKANKLFNLSSRGQINTLISEKFKINNSVKIFKMQF